MDPQHPRDLVRGGFDFTWVLAAAASLGPAGGKRAPCIAPLRARSAAGFRAIGYRHRAFQKSSRPRRVRFPNEIVLTLRGRNGSPGVNILTPVLRAGNDTAVLVNRGWVYSPDGMTFEPKQWREGGNVDANAFVEVFPTKGPFDKPSQARPRSMRRLDRAVLVKLFPYPIANYYVVLTDSARSGGPPRVEPASLDEGPHRNYAIQWFFFAAISIIGLVIFLRRT